MIEVRIKIEGNSKDLNIDVDNAYSKNKTKEEEEFSKLIIELIKSVMEHAIDESGKETKANTEGKEVG